MRAVPKRHSQPQRPQRRRGPERSTTARQAGRHAGGRESESEKANGQTLLIDAHAHLGTCFGIREACARALRAESQLARWLVGWLRAAIRDSNSDCC